MTVERIVGVIGTGRANPNIIEDSLNELVDHSEFVLPWYGGKPCDSLDRVYTAIIDFEYPYHIVGTTPPKSIIRPAISHDETESPNTLVVEKTKSLGGDTILVLWDDTPETEVAILEAHSRGMRLLDLTNAMAPIDVVDTDPAPVVDDKVEEERPVDEEEPGAFTEQELRSQPIASLRRQAKMLGLEHDKNATKGELVDLLLGNLPEVGLLVEEPEEVAKQFTAPKVACLAWSYDDKVETINVNPSLVGPVQEVLNGLKKLLQP